MDLSPFEPPLAQPSEDGWRGGVHRRPLWKSVRGRSLDAAGVHALLRAADLPRAELLHIGFTDKQLSASAPALLSRSRLLIPLGRIVLDSRYHAIGGRFDVLDVRDVEEAVELGRAVVGRWFS